MILYEFKDLSEMASFFELKAKEADNRVAAMESQSIKHIHIIEKRQEAATLRYAAGLIRHSRLT